jgi:RNA recognition motif-containing protein
VSGLSYDATKEDVEAHFNTFTTVKSVNLLTDRNTGRSKGLAFVKFNDQESLDLALQNNKTEHMGRWLNIEQAQSREERQNFQQPQSGNSATLFIGNLSFTTEESTLQKAFSKYG